jgi:hypothetical protein
VQFVLVIVNGCNEMIDCGWWKGIAWTIFLSGSSVHGMLAQLVKPAQLLGISVSPCVYWGMRRRA